MRCLGTATAAGASPRRRAAKVRALAAVTSLVPASSLLKMCVCGALAAGGGSAGYVAGEKIGAKAERHRIVARSTPRMAAAVPTPEPACPVPTGGSAMVAAALPVSATGGSGGQGGGGGGLPHHSPITAPGGGALPSGSSGPTIGAVPVGQMPRPGKALATPGPASIRPPVTILPAPGSPNYPAPGDGAPPSPAPATTAAVPTPPMVALFGLGAAILATRRR